MWYKVCGMLLIAGSDRQSKPERRNIWALQQNVSSNSVIEIHTGSSFVMRPEEYAASE